MEHNSHQPARLERRGTILGLETSAPDPSQMKSELFLQQRKFERLEQKEKRIQVKLQIPYRLLNIWVLYKHTGYPKTTQI